jgi:hypothetical protein
LIKTGHLRKNLSTFSRVPPTLNSGSRRDFRINDHGYIPLVVNTSRSIPHLWFITGFATRVTRPVLLVEQELPTLPEHLSSTRVLSCFCSIFWMLQTLYSDNYLSHLFTHVQDVISQHLRTYYLLSENLLRLRCNVFIFLLPNTNKPTIVILS